MSEPLTELPVILFKLKSDIKSNPQESANFPIILLMILALTHIEIRERVISRIRKRETIISRRKRLMRL
jgi:hypothetical protein